MVFLKISAKYRIVFAQTVTYDKQKYCPLSNELMCHAVWFIQKLKYDIVLYCNTMHNHKLL